MQKRNWESTSRKEFLTLFLAFVLCNNISALVKPGALSSQYLYDHQNYEEALSGWQEELRREPTSLSALFAVWELTLFVEGRAKLSQQIATFVDGTSKKLPRTELEKAKKRLTQLQSTFISDLGQARFLQAAAKAERGLWSENCELLNQAFNSEQGNIQVLKKKADCERKLRRWNQYFSTLKKAYQDLPFDRDIQKQLLNAYLYFEEYEKALTMVKTRPASLRNREQVLALGLAHLELGDYKASLSSFWRHVRGDFGENLSPVVLYGMGKIYAEFLKNEKQATRYYKKFVKEVKQAHFVPRNLWDPYHLSQRLSEAKQFLTKN